MKFNDSFIVDFLVNNLICLFLILSIGFDLLWVYDFVIVEFCLYF